MRIFDQNVEGLDDEGLFELIGEFQPDLAGFSVITPNYPVARRQMRRLKQLHPELWVLAGGIHATLFPDDLIADGADVVVLGEGEPVICQLVAGLAEGRDLSGCRVCVLRTPGRDRAYGGSWPDHASLDDLPFVDRSLYHLSQYTHHSMLASRGCPHHCAFCCNYTGTVRSDGVAIRQHEQVIAEMEYLRDTYGAREIFFADDIFLLRKPDILEFCRACAHRRVGVKWIGQMRADRVDANVADAMRAAGCQRIYFGVEAGSERILRAAQKGHDHGANPARHPGGAGRRIAGEDRLDLWFARHAGRTI